MKDSVQERFYYGRVYLDQGEYDNAVIEFNRALEIEPQNPNVLINLGKCYLFKSEPEDAARCLEEAVAVAHEYADAHFFLGKAYLELGLQEKAINEFKESLNINPRYEAAKRLLNRHMRVGAGRRGENEQKPVAGEEERLSRRANIHFHMGNALFQKKLYQEALLEYKEAIRLRPNFPDIRSRLGELYMKRGTYGLAEEEFQLALKINPKYIGALIKLAETYRLHSEQLLDSAEQAFKKVLEISPEDSEALSGLEKVRAVKNLDFV